jgi:hypothetical protein
MINDMKKWTVTDSHYKSEGCKDIEIYLKEVI